MEASPGEGSSASRIIGTGRRKARTAAQVARDSLADPAYGPRLARGYVRKKRRQWQDYRKFLRKEFGWQAPLSDRRPLWWRKGFLSRSVTVYDLQNNDPSLYVNDVQRYTKTKRMVSPFLQEVLDNKFSFFLLVNNLGLKSDVVPLLGLHSRGRVHRFPSAERLPLEEFLRSTLDAEPRVFVKPLRGAEAKGVRSLRRADDGYRMDGSPSSLEEIRDWVAGFNKPLLFERAVDQHEFQAAINPHATNTLRVLTMPDLQDDDEPFIVAAAHRFGTERSGHVDNWVQGGLSAEIDVETGMLGRAAQLPDETTLDWFTRHPDTGAQIEGAQVPFWEETKELILDAARRLSFMEYVGWDVIISPTGPVILEANINSGMNVLQVHRPLLADPRVKAYYTERGVI